ncbi:MAG: hypothetical protein KA789_08770 [Parabacteroides sp.]|nr:hypothetical protein [Parabacteroides sp.]
MENLSNLMIGIISGIVSTVIIWSVILFYNKIIKTAIKELLYKGIDLEGEWHADIFHEKEVEVDGKKKKVKEKLKEFNLTVKQSAYQLKGDLIIKNIDGEKEYFSFYNYTGFIKDNYIILTYLPKSKKCIGLGSIILIVKEGGKCIKGDLCGTSLAEMDLVHVNNINFERKI